VVGAALRPPPTAEDVAEPRDPSSTKSGTAPVQRL